MDLHVRPFHMGTEKEAALKPLEEAAEAFGAWQDVDFCLRHMPLCDGCDEDGGRGECAAKLELADEVADVIQAACNLAARYGIDLEAAMARCEGRNRGRGRYGEGAGDDQ